MTSRGLSLDTGALIAIERGDPHVRQLVAEALKRGVDVHVVAGVVARAWRGGARQVRLARALDADGITVPELDEFTARAVGEMCAASGHADVVDVHVVLNARLHGHRVVTTDKADLRKVDPTLPLLVI